MHSDQANLRDDCRGDQKILQHRDIQYCGLCFDYCPRCRDPYHAVADYLEITNVSSTKDCRHCNLSSRGSVSQCKLNEYVQLD